jgi:hypothetical protein
MLFRKIAHGGRSLASPEPLCALPAAHALRLQRIFARLQDGAGYADIAAEKGFSRERLRQIIRAATAPDRGWTDRTTSGCRWPV